MDCAQTQNRTIKKDDDAHIDLASIRRKGVVLSDARSMVIDLGWIVDER